MGNKLSFYIKESLKYLNQSKLTILTLAIAVSMVAGFGYYFDSAQKFILHETNYNTFDFAAKFLETDDLTYGVSDSELDVQQLFIQSNLLIEQTYFYRVISNSQVSLCYKDEQATDIFNLVWLAPDFQYFQSPRFDQYFEIVEGNRPLNPNEMIFDSIFAQRFNLQVGSNQTLSFMIGLVNRTIIEVPNINIVGFYTPKQEFVQFGVDLPFFEIGSNFVFISKNFTDASEVYPHKELVERVIHHPEFPSFRNYHFLIQTYLGMEFNRDSINIAWLSASATSIMDSFNQFSLHLPEYVESYNIISPVLQTQFQFQTSLRLLIQFANLPLYIFAIYMGSVANKSKVRKRYHEFFAMRMRGFPKNMIRNQLLVEAIINSIFVSLIGIILGIAIFFLSQYWLNPLFLVQFNKSGFALSLFFSWRTVLEAFIFGIVLNILASLSTIKHVNSQKTSNLASELANVKGDVDYDESTLYFKSNEKSDEISEKLELVNFMKKKEELIPKWGIIAAISSLVPIILFITMIFGQNIQTSDTLIEISEALFNNLNILIILTMLSPFMLVVGIIRFLVVESPPRFAKISKRIAHIFMKKRDYFVGIEMVREKSHTRIIFLSGLYVALLMFANMSTNSLIRQENLRVNLQTGTDLTMDFSISSRYFNNIADIERFESQLKDIQLENGEYLVNDVVHAYVSKTYSGTSLRTKFILNLSEYLPLITAHENILPNSQFLSDIQEVIDYNNDLLDEPDRAGIICSSSFMEMNNFQIGDRITFLQSSVNFSSSNYIAKQVTAKIIKVIDVMPGLYFSSSESQSDFMVVSDHIFSDYGDDIIPVMSVREMINLNPVDRSSENDYEIYAKYLQNSTDYTMMNTEFRFYDYNWESVDSSSFNDSNVPYLGLFYFNLIIIGVILAVGVAILMVTNQDLNKGLYGELIARGFGRKGINLLVLTEMSISFLLALLIGTVSGSITSLVFCRLFSLSGGGGFITLPVYFNYGEFLIILAGIFGLTYLFMGFSFYKNSKYEISEFLLEVE
ncbi:MAG: FtsX-like permease family protein [Promethearchaeota archaeon]